MKHIIRKERSGKSSLRPFASKALVAVSLLATMGSASALDFTFSSVGSLHSGGVNASMTGEIFGLSDNATGNPASVEVFTVNGVTVNTIFQNTGSAYYENFTVTNGQITAANYGNAIVGAGLPPNQQLIPGTPYSFEELTLGYAGQNHASFDPGIGSPTAPLVYVNNTGFSATTYTLAAVPEPENYAMLLAGLGLVGAAIKRRKAAQS